MVQYLITIVALAFGTFSDLRHRSVTRALILAYLLTAAAAHLGYGDWTPLSVFAGIVPGVAFGIIALISGGDFGTGDALMIFCCGFSLGLSRCLGILMISFLLAGIFSFLLVCFKKRTKRSTIPLIPFLLIGSIAQGVYLLVQQK